jgi:alpha-ketoglutarate-dependent taurine dioxygenase
MSEKSSEQSATERFSGRRRRSVKLSSAELVRYTTLPETDALPLVIEPEVENLNLVSWAESNRELIEAKLMKHGALLFRGFEMESVNRFELFVRATSDGPLKYTERSSPRSSVSGNIYTSTDYPVEQSIFLHNEQSYNATFPMRIYFCCLLPAQEGGETPIADARRIFQHIDPRIRETFIRKNYLYVRNFVGGFGLSWQTAFQTTERRVVEEYCRENEIDFEWRDGHRLRTSQLRRAAAAHPVTGQMTWFNHATFFHITTLNPQVRERLLAEFGEEDLPNNTYYGDGSPIEPAVMEELRRAYLVEKIRFGWRGGDILMLDNMLVAHGREPFVGPRQVVVGMANQSRWSDV